MLVRLGYRRVQTQDRAQLVKKPALQRILRLSAATVQLADDLLRQRGLSIVNAA